jgi:hypothetical protein
MLAADTTITIKTRSLTWFTAGIAVTLALGAVVVGVRAYAEPSVSETTFVPITPCRAFDTRPGTENVGLRNTPIGADEEHTQQITGVNGNCNISITASAVAMNVTAVGATTRSFLQVFPADVTRPTEGSSLNYDFGQTPTPNKVDVKLSASGAIKLYNSAGTVHIIGDIVGYYTNTGIQDLQRQFDKTHVWSARVGANAEKFGKGPYTASRFSLGRYGVNFDVSGRGFRSGDWFTAVANPTCAGYTASVLHGGGSSSQGDDLVAVGANVQIYDENGNPVDCSFSLLLRMDDPNPRIVAVGN